VPLGGSWNQGQRDGTADRFGPLAAIIRNRLRIPFRPRHPNARQILLALHRQPGQKCLPHISLAASDAKIGSVNLQSQADRARNRMEGQVRGDERGRPRGPLETTLVQMPGQVFPTQSEKVWSFKPKSRMAFKTAARETTICSSAYLRTLGESECS